VKGNTGANNSMSGFKQLYYNPTTHEIVYCWVVRHKLNTTFTNIT
jgi:hypothetical protein